MGAVNGFDLSALNAYWWHPGAERMELARMPHRRLSAPFAVHCLDLQARVDAALARQAAAANSNSDSAAASGSQGAEATEEASSPPSSASDSRNGSEEEASWEHDAWLDIPVTAAGHWNAVAFWFEVHAGGGAAVTSWGEGRGSEAARADDGEAAAGEAAKAGGAPAAATSWGQAVQYLDGQAVTAGSSVRLRVRQDSGQLVFTSDPPQCRPRHAIGEHVAVAAALPAVLLAGANGMGWRNVHSCMPKLPSSTLATHLHHPPSLPPSAVPRWHFDMVLDAQRNDAYAAAIGRAVQRKREAGCTKLLALDLGAGTGLLSMMAARWVGLQLLGGGGGTGLWPQALLLPWVVHFCNCHTTHASAAPICSAGADEMVAAEVSQHMCDVGEETCIMNGFLGRITLLDRCGGWVGGRRGG